MYFAGQNRREVLNTIVSSLSVSEEFVRRFVRCQPDLYAYIVTLVPNVADAQDILQETAIAILEQGRRVSAG